MSTEEDDLSNAIRTSEWDKARTVLGRENAGEQIAHSDEYGWNSLHEACCNSDMPLDVWQSMLAAPTKALLKQDNLGRTPLHLAIIHASNQVIGMIIEACPQAVRLSDRGGLISLHYATEYSRIPEVIWRLLILHPSTVMATNNKSDTPLHYFFRKWNGALRKSIRCFTHGEIFFIDHCVEREYGEMKKIQEIYDITVLLLQAAVHGTIEDHLTPFQILCSSMVCQQCPCAYFSMIFKIHPEQATHQDEGGNFLLHIACVTKSSSDSELYKCHKCNSNLKKTSWFQHKRIYRIYCQECFLQKDKVENDYIPINPLDKIPVIINELIAVNPKAASFPNHAGRLPLNLAIEHGESYERGGAKTIFKAAPAALSTRDILTYIYPFMLAAVKNNQEARTNQDKPLNVLLEQFTSCFALLMENPVLLSMGIPIKGGEGGE